ncbi:MAG: SDR family oxidoreductase [Nitrosomonadales bacterium]|nr:SDR family oxidoreductase [Nitrosomonadales bacterium]
MNLKDKRILITGAAGGIGRLVCLLLANKGADLLLADRPGEALEALLTEINGSGGKARVLHTNLLEQDAGESLAQAAQEAGGVDVLINLAGILSFRLFQNENAENIQRMWQVNVIAPMQLTRALLPAMLARGSGRVVNIGSIFGSIAFVGFATYSANKFAVRGLSEALRRELDGTGVDVTYIAPRYTKTPINAGAAARMSEALKMNMDDPDLVATNIVRAIEKDAKDYYIGFPECLFVRLNAILPRVVDCAMRKQNAQIREYARNE